MPYLYHSFVSAKTDSADSGLVRPTNWNARFKYGNVAATGPGSTDAFVREVLTAARDYYVRTDGNDSNDGLSNTAAGAFLTIQAAFDTIFETLDLGNQTVTVNVGTGTFTGLVSVNAWIGGGTVLLSGNGAANTIISTTTGSAITSSGNNLYIQNLKITTATGFLRGLQILSGSVTFGTGMEFGACSGHQIEVGNNAIFQANSVSYTISGSAYTHWIVGPMGYAAMFGATVTLTGTPAFTAAFVTSYNNSNVQIDSTSTTFIGSATGPRYTVNTNSIIATGGGGATYLPGNVGGTADGTTGGYYT